MNDVLCDLHWAVTSPPLLVDPHLSPTLQAAIESFDPTSIDRRTLQDFLSAAPGHRVGHYFERLILFWLSHVCGFQIIAHRHQIQDNKRTIGELDFLFRDASGQLHHWETAVKFYLRVATPLPDRGFLIGPNAADSFDRKVARIYQHQLPLSKRIFDEPICRHAFVKGRIFYPLRPLSGNQMDSEAPKLALSHLRGVWLRAKELCWFEHQPSGNRYKLLQKPHWLAPERAASSPQCLSAIRIHDVLRTHFEQASHPRMCSVLAPRDGEYKEVERLFVVSNDWPNRPAGSEQAE